MASEDPAELIRQIASTMTVAEQKELLDTLLRQQADAFFMGLREPPLPDLRRKPRRVRGFQVRFDLQHAKPPVWRRLVFPGDLTLDRVHTVIQAAMGWTDSHLHCFRTGADHFSPRFITEFDLSEGDEGIVEDEVRLDQVVADVGDRLWYEYDFGDGWDHILTVEKVLPDPPAEVELLSGRRACPPEDVGGIGGYAAVAAWVEAGYDDSLLPEQLDDAEHARCWLPNGWHPAEFDREFAADSIRLALAAPGDSVDG